MRSALLIALGLALGAGLTLLLVGPDREPTPTDDDAFEQNSDQGDAPAVGSQSDTARLDRIERMLEALGQKVGALADRPERVRDQAGDSAVSPAVQITEAVLLEALERAEQAREQRRLDQLNTAQLLAEARRLRSTEPVAARRALDHLLARPLPQPERVQGLLQLGLLHRRHGETDDAERALRTAADLGAGTDDGGWATYYLATSAARRGAHEEALRLGRHVAGQPGLNLSLRVHGEWAAAVATEALGDPAAARAEYRRLLETYADNPSYGWLEKDLLERIH